MSRAAQVRAPSGKDRIPRAAALAFLLLLLALLVVPAPAAAPTVLPFRKAEPAVIRTTIPTPVMTLPPVAEPARVNRTTLVQAVKNVADRPRVSVPSGLFLVLVIIAGFGILAIVYFVLRRWAGLPAGTKPPAKSLPGSPTVIGETSPPVPAAPATDGGPAVAFPLSLEKRFSRAEFIGEGGLARVFRATNTRTGMTVAVKVPVRYDEATGTHFTRDIVNWQGLGHENIIRIGSSNILPVPYIEMEYAPSSLASIPLPVPEDRALAILLGVARGIAYAHEKGIVHRDIKPENVLLSAEGVPKITDWGLAKAVDDPRQSSVLGFSPAYAAPEQLAPHRFGRPGPATDVYQLGMLLCGLLTGAPAFRKEGMLDLTIAIIEDEPVIAPWNGRHEEELRAIILRCLAKRPEDRYASVADLIRDIERVAADGR